MYALLTLSHEAYHTAGDTNEAVTNCHAIQALTYVAIALGGDWREAERRAIERFLVGAVLSLPVLIGAMPEFFPFAPLWLRDPWLHLLPATPVQFWVGWEFHRGFVRDLRHRSASMSTLVSIGTNVPARAAACFSGDNTFVSAVSTLVPYV